MRHTFSWKHALTMLVLACLLSIVAGAVLAQEPAEPDPEDAAPEIPVFDLSGSAQEPTEPEPEDAVNPLIVIEPMAVPSETPVIISPADGSVVTVLDPDFEFSDPPAGTVLTYAVWELSQGFFDPSGTFFPYSGQTPKILKFVDADGNEVTNPIGVTDTTSTAAADGYSVFESAAVTIPSGGLTNGIRYIVQAGFTNFDGRGPIAQSSFVIDIASVSPADGSTVITTTPLITWPETDGATYYHLIAATPDSTSSDGFSYFSYWFPNLGDDVCAAFPAGPSQPSCSSSYAASEICADGQCKARPSVGLDWNFFNDIQIEIGDFDVTLYAVANNSPSLSIEEFSDALEGTPLTTFTVLAPNVSADPDDGVTEGRPGFTVDRVGQTVDEILPAGVDLLGMTETIYPDFYQIYVIDEVGDLTEQWFYVSNGGNNTPCTDDGELAPCDLRAFVGDRAGVQEILYNGDYQYLARGYSSRLDAYTPFADFGEFTVNEEPPTADSLVVAGFYEVIGPDSDNPNPLGLTSTWVPCATEDGKPLCTSLSPYVHIAPHVGRYSGDWIGIAHAPADFGTDEEAAGEIYFNYFNVNEPQFFGNDGLGEYWQCGDFFGGGAFTSTTCFFRAGILDEEGSLDAGDDYLFFVGSYGPGGASEGGYVDSGFILEEFSTTPPPAVEGLAVDVEGVAFTFTFYAPVPADYDYTEPLTFTDYEGYPGFTETLLTGVPKFYWEDAPSAEFYGILVYAPEDSQNGFIEAGTIISGGDYDGDDEPENFFWVDANEICDFDGICAYQFDGADAEFYDNGNYQVYVVYYDGGVSDFAFADFTVDAPEPTAPLTSTVSVYVFEGLTGTLSPIFEWRHAQGNDYYNLQIADESGEVIIGFDFEGEDFDGLWYPAANICRTDEVLDEDGNPILIEVQEDDSFFSFPTQQLGVFCVVDLYDVLIEEGDIDALLAPGTYTFQINSFGPGSPEIIEGPSESFIIPNVDVAPITGIYPAMDQTVESTNIPTLIFEAAEGASWYQFFVAAPTPAAGPGAETGFYEAVIFNFFYRPIAYSQEEADELSENGIQSCVEQTTVFTPDGEVTLDEPAYVCYVSYSPSAEDSAAASINFYGNVFSYDDTYQWWVQPLEADFLNEDSTWSNAANFTIDLGLGDPVVHSCQTLTSTLCFFNGIRAAGDNFNRPLHNGLFADFNVIDWYRPVSDPQGTETLAYQVEIVDVASGAVLDVPVELDTDGDGVNESYKLVSDLAGIILPDWVNCESGGNFYCRLFVDVDYFTSYGVYEIKVGSLSQGALEWEGPAPDFESYDPETDWVYPPADGSFGTQSAKFTKL